MFSYLRLQIVIFLFGLSLPDGALKKGENFVQPILSPTMVIWLICVHNFRVGINHVLF